MKKAETGQESYQTIYQRSKYAPIKREIARKKKNNFLSRYPNWEKQKYSLTDEERYILDNYYGLNGQRLFNREIARELNITTQWLYEKRKKIEAKLEKS
jgi:DNA-binding CsgD family transcriptional regulator